MNTLFVTGTRPHRPDSGAALRNVQNISAFTGLGRVDVISIGGDDEIEEPVPGIGAWHHYRWQPPRLRLPGAWMLHPRGLPQLDRHRHPDAERRLQSLLGAGNYAVAVVEGVLVSPYIAPIRAAGVPVVYDAHNVEANLVADLGREAKTDFRVRLRQAVADKRLQRAERDACQAADLVWCCSEIDADELRRLYTPSTPIAVVPNSVDLEAYAAVRASQSNWPPAETPMKLIYPALFSYAPNRFAAMELIKDIVPALRARGERPKLILAGRNPTPEMIEAGSNDPDIMVTGAVPSVLPYLAGPSLMPVPLRNGSGTRLKVLEAFAAGCAVVSTAKGAEGIGAVEGRDIRLAETTDEFVDAMCTLWRDNTARMAQVTAALRLVEECYSWPAAVRTVHASLRRYLGSRLAEPQVPG